jgi:hypothetical protein
LIILNCKIDILLKKDIKINGISNINTRLLKEKLMWGCKVINNTKKVRFSLEFEKNDFFNCFLEFSTFKKKKKAIEL